MDSTDDADNTEAANICCASCGIAEVDEIKLKNCDDCDLVRYCSDKCQEDHRPNHEAMCKERATELRDEILFRQPESSYLGDCPICCLPVPLDETQSNMQACCSNIICKGCTVANMSREVEENKHPRCVFCRRSIIFTDEERHKNNLKRVEANDPIVIFKMGVTHFRDGEYERAFEYFTKSADLGDANAHLKLAIICGYVSKEDFASALRAHQAAVDATKSPQREEADKLFPTS
eukprot:scaffold12047_cov78-Skeletonema_marinoi.AAC.1